ncbi:MAG: calycin-like domain-containing protein [Dysgonomonas sp.]
MNKKITQKIILLVIAFVGYVNIYANDISDNVAGTYTGKLSIDVSAIAQEPAGTVVLNTPDQIQVDKNSADKINLMLKNFSFGGMSLGDININDIPVIKTAENTYTFESETVNLSFMGGFIQATAKASGTMDGNGGSSIFIDVNTLGVNVPVNFDGNLIFDGLRLSDILLNGTSISDGTFDPNDFNYSNKMVTETDVLTFVPADPASKVNVELDGNWICLYVTDGTKSNRYAIASLDEEQGYVMPITKITLGQDISGDLKLSNGTEIVSDNPENPRKVEGNIIYNKPIDGNNWNTIGLPYYLSLVQAVKEDGSKFTPNAYWYSYNYGENPSPEEVTYYTPCAGFIMKLKTETDAESLDLISEKNSTIEKPGISVSTNGYSVFPNNTLTTITMNDVKAVFDVYYIFDGTEFVKADPSTELLPATMFIGYKGSTPVEKIDVPDTNGSSIENLTSNNLQVYSTNGTVYINNFEGVAEVYALNGGKVFEKQVNGSDKFQLSSGTYIVRTGQKATITMVK